MAKGKDKAIGKRAKKDSDEPYTVGKKGMPAKEKDPNAPKRPMSSYFHFLNDRRKSVKEEHPTMKMGESTKLMTGEWNKMTDKVKKKYEDLAAVDKKRYYAECEKKGIKLKSQQKEIDPANPPPKKPQSAYFLFQAEQREKLKKDKPDLKQTDLMKLIGSEWSALTATKKKKYEDMVEKDKARYEKEKKAFDSGKGRADEETQEEADAPNEKKKESGGR
jgi:hypothetical protein